MEKTVNKESFKDEDNLVQCECGNWHHWEYSASDGDGNNACPSCTMEFQSELIINMKKMIVGMADPELSKEQIIHMLKAQYSKIVSCSVEDLDEIGYFDDIELD